MSMINIFELNYNRDQKEIKKYKIFRRILDKIHTRIKHLSKKCVSYLFYKIPDFVLGIPAYKIEECGEYIRDKLERNGFVVVLTPPNLLYISWDHIPSSIKYPHVDNLREEFINNPETDYSYLVSQLNSNSNAVQVYKPTPQTYKQIETRSNSVGSINNPSNWDSMSNISSSLFQTDMDITSNANIKSVVVSNNNKQSNLDRFSYSYSNQRL